MPDSRSNPPIALRPFQEDAVQQTCANLDAEGAALLVSPTGSGKTAQMLTVAERHVARARETGRLGRVLILTHRRELARQILEREAEKWCDRDVGSLAGHLDGGVDEAPEIVVGMVQTAARRAPGIADYDLVIVDECHHMYDAERRADADKTGDGEQVSDYEVVLGELEGRGLDVRLLGATATAFRAEGELHPRLRAASEHLVTYREVLDDPKARIVAPRTVEMDYRLAGGARAQDWLDAKAAERPGERLAKDVGAGLKRARGTGRAERSAFAREVVAGWQREAGDLKTLGFADSVREMEDLRQAFEAAGVRVEAVHSGLSDDHNARAQERYRSPDGPQVLLSVQMIGEGYDVPETQCALVTNGCPPRGWYAQMVGRAMRRDDAGEEQHAVVLDFGAGSRMWGRMEEQIDLQHDRQMMERDKSPLRRRMHFESVVERPEPDLPVMAFAGREKTYYGIETGAGQVLVYEDLRHYGRDGRLQGNKNRMSSTDIAGRGRGKPVPLGAFKQMVKDELDANPGWHARMRQPDASGVPRDVALARSDFASRKSHLGTIAEPIVAQRLERIGRVGDLGSRAGRAASAIAQVQDAETGRAPDPRLLAARAQALGDTPKEARVESLMLAGLVAGQLADRCQGEPRKSLRAVHARLHGELGEGRIRAAAKTDGRNVRTMCRLASERFAEASAALEADGRGELAGVAKAWRQHLSTAARVHRRVPQKDAAASAHYADA